MRILLVEDNQDTLATMAAVLRYEQYEVVTARDGILAAEIAKLYPPDVAVLDIGLPGIDGYELARILRKQAGGRPLHIVAITGYGKPEDKERALEAGIDSHITKPADPSVVIKLLQNVASRFQG